MSYTDTVQHGLPCADVMLGGHEDSGRMSCSVMNRGSVCTTTKIDSGYRDTQRNDVTILEKVAFGEGSVMVWGAFSHNHRTPLYHIQVSLNGLRYRDEILWPLTIPTLQQIGGLRTVYQDDNARLHRAEVVNDFLNRSGVDKIWTHLLFSFGRCGFTYYDP